jgi:tyrosinase
LTSLGHVYVRQEIRDLKNNHPDQWALYILGLRKFYNSNQSNPLSLYEIAGTSSFRELQTQLADHVLGIHGRPYKVWQDAQGLPGKSGGYCPHNNIMFLGWHRPYLALFEVRALYHQLVTAW